MEEYAKERNIQFIMCTHSPEILSGAFKEPDCTLLHLKSSTDLTRIVKQSFEEYSVALQRLGTSVGETLFYEGTIFVEGGTDIAFLEIGFPDLIRKYQLKDRGGRREIEKAIEDLQALEKKGEKVAPIFLIFDRDDTPSGLQSSEAVRVLQWPRRCVENYMIDIDVISELLRDPAVSRKPIESAGEVHRLCRELAFSQLDAVAAREAYSSRGYLNSSITKEDIKANSVQEIAVALYDRMSKARASIPDVAEAVWIQQFVAEVEVRRKELELSWDDKWKEVCDGKKLISDLHKKTDPRMAEISFKERIIRRMRDTTSDNWISKGPYRGPPKQG
jgi:hypothetical protein